MLKSSKFLTLTQNTEGKIMKIYDYNGKKNVCGKRVKELRKKTIKQDYVLSD